MAEALGHTIRSLAPSLFTFQIEDARLSGMEGLSVPTAGLIARHENYETCGLVTHWG